MPIYGMNRGTVGFLMNEWRLDRLAERLAGAKAIRVAPLEMRATTRRRRNLHRTPRSTKSRCCAKPARPRRSRSRSTAASRLPELVCDGVLVATPAGSTAYNLSAHGPILPLDAELLALTPISPFRPRRWRGAILPDDTAVSFRVLEPDKRPVSAVADQTRSAMSPRSRCGSTRSDSLTLLFDPEHALDERIVMEQFAISSLRIRSGRGIGAVVRYGPLPDGFTVE